MWQMQPTGYAGRVGGVAVALGIGSAVAMGWGCATAAADTSGSTSSSGSSVSKGPSVSKGSSADKDESTRTASQKASSVSTKNSAPESKDTETSSADTADQQKSRAHRTDQAERPSRRPRLETPVEPSPADGAVAVISEPVETSPSRTRRTLKVEVPSPELDAVEVAVTAVPGLPSSEQIVSPANSRPLTPADGPTALAALALARRDLEKPVRGPEKEARSALVTQQAASPIGLAPGVVVPPSVIGHYEVTGAPSLTDRITVFAMEVLDKISDVIGVNIVTKLGEAILSPKPPWFTTLGLDVTKSEYDSRDVWTITPPNSSGEVVVGLHVSGFYYPPNIIHWLDYTQMARQTGATVIVPRYPLIPDGGTAANTVPPMSDFIATQVQAHGADKVSVYGDSAGATLAMLAVQKAVRDCDGDAACLAARVPSRMVLVSPGLSGPETYTDPNAVLVKDPVLDIPNPGDFAEWEDPLLSNPNLGPFVGLPPTTVYVGSREISAPGVLTFGDRLLTADPDAGYHVVIGMGQIHNWAQGGGIPINSQTGRYRDDVYRQLGIVADQAV